MKMSARGLAALLATTAAVAVAAPQASPKAPAAPRAAEAAAAPITAQSLATPRQKASYVVGYELSQMLTPIAPDFDLASFREGVQNLIDGKPPMLTRERAMELNQVLVQRIAARRDPKAPKAPDVSKQEVGRLVSMDLGPSLVGIKDEIDLPIVYRALGDLLAGQAPVLDEATRTAVHNEFTAMVKQKMEAKRAGQSTANRDAGQKFLAENKTKKGVFTTGSGLQYMVLRQGSGARPKPSDRVRVNYHGTLLDGTVFDSSYDRGQPAEFMLNQVIPGWTEGVSMMPVGAKYRFWIPSELAYGEKGAGAQIGPNSTLVFDVELLAIAP